jgi:hypothetical protein
MGEKISLKETSGKTISGQVEVRDGIVTVTTHDGSAMAAEIAGSMLSPETLARSLVLELSRRRQAAGNLETARALAS